MASTPLEIAKELRLPLTRLYLLYFRQTENSHISMAQLSILMILEENGPMRISQIAATETIRMPTASNAVNQLETMELVTRVRDTSDRRGVSVTLTDKGREELRRLSEERAEQLASMLDSLSDEELKEVAEATPVIELVLRRYTEAIEAKLNNDQQ
ncbi:MarR family winged helix-turn-helix transcriptional regulator [Corynebacterium macclintockiae]|uniref:MarR family transcriptional regulator n=1 Tax=Corynebacterium macclintockiae TaxID=2913501 RepID=A0A9X3M7M8_9CORY|nr:MULTISPECIES: MarR family transcriptional regulator [Corynebacterium]MBC6794851.1 MarR family transcriptional regulator [Corynebacterium sp. LK28]MCZ9305153.1 MarR family transcriptional regulator [Corynebacterium macclintockiae]MDK8869983.1 MarR family transcriptional regulator [Corynebacterium macclintockiae]MDK8891132.1 MarR family transcriptional regulator [Corynebacterium macclintockiae]OFM60134.1 MarR family transcriptional regulator [Corynebacterium sp. HMSC058E07]